MVLSVSFASPPPSAAWLHREARSGFEVAYLQNVDEGHLITGCTAAVEDGQAWTVEYELHLDPGWVTRSAHVRSRTIAGTRMAQLKTDGEGHWSVDGQPAVHLDGCLDVDLESSALTNALPVHRLCLEPGERAQAPVAYVRAVSLDVVRLEQEYTRTNDCGHQQRYHYTAPVFDFACELVYDEAGLVLTYPGIAERAH